MKRIFIVHRWSGGPEDDWRPWVKKELESIGFSVRLLSMPDSDEPNIEKWIAHLAQEVGSPDRETYFIGHSIGCQTILRYLENVSSTVGGAIFVSGWFTLLNLEDREVKEIAAPWVETPLDTEKIKSVLPKSVLIISDNDPYGGYDFNVQKFTEVGSEIVTVHNAGHITEEEGYTTLPLVPETFKKWEGIE